MSREAPYKAEKDFSETLNEQFPQIDSLAEVCLYSYFQFFAIERGMKDAGGSVDA